FGHIVIAKPITALSLVGRQTTVMVVLWMPELRAFVAKKTSICNEIERNYFRAIPLIGLLTL
ncbi:hypothetical protein, partial [Chitinibacter sp. ZOR0017]|uniref:hypothetical protein n=1 Tax=Chitinibacter sp. ZOR0017 TaxID=1339254 RepID=UPI001E3D5800